MTIKFQTICFYGLSPTRQVLLLNENCFYVTWYKNNNASCNRQCFSFQSVLHQTYNFNDKEILFYELNIRMQSEYRKIRTRKNSLFGHFSHSAKKEKSHRANLTPEKASVVAMTEFLLGHLLKFKPRYSYTLKSSVNEIQNRCNENDVKILLQTT